MKEAVDEQKDLTLAEVENTLVARVQPEHKTRIVEAWKSRDQIGDHYLDDPDDRKVDDDLVAAEIASGEKRAQI